MSTTRVKQKSQKVSAVNRGVWESTAMNNDELALKFTNDESFGNFCIKLKEERVQFRMMGNKTIVVLGAKQISDVPDRARNLLYALKGRGHVDVLAATPPTKRTLPTEEEAKKVFRERAKRYA